MNDYYVEDIDELHRVQTLSILDLKMALIHKREDVHPLQRQHPLSY